MTFPVVLTVPFLFFLSLPSAKVTNPDITRIINSSEIQAVVRPAGRKNQRRPWTQKKNPLINKGVLFRLNPYAKTLRRQELRTTFSWLLLGLISHVSLLSSQAGAAEEETYEEAKGPQGSLRGFPQDSLCSLILLVYGWRMC